MASLTSRGVFLSGAALLFAAGTAVTTLWFQSMSEMGGMLMPGGWTMSMAWMRMPGQSWSDVATSFLGMWVAMTVMMMLPSLVPMLWRYRCSMAGREHLGRLTVVAGLGYFAVWSVVGIAVFPLGIAFATLEMQEPALARAVPTVMGVAVALLGALQLTTWKARRLACCREAPGCRTLPAGPWQQGLRLGLQCTACCANLMAIPLVVGVMDLRAMAVATAAITLERLVPAGQRVARAVGVAMIGAGLALLMGTSNF